LLTSFSTDGEHTPNTFSEARGSILRASAAILMATPAPDRFVTKGEKMSCRGRALPIGRVEHEAPLY